jgi:hypothetical protein
LRPGNRTVLLIQPAPVATVKPAGDSEKKQ